MYYTILLDELEVNLLQVALDHMEEHLNEVMEDKEMEQFAIHRLGICLQLQEQLKKLNKIQYYENKD